VEFLPDEVRERENFPSLQKALHDLHCPSLTADIVELQEERSEAHRRLIYEELFLFSVEMAIHRKAYFRREGQSFSKPDQLWELFRKNLEFRFTEDQRRVLSEIVDDMQKPGMMHRILQGDVGSGKTVVAAAASLVAVNAGKQVALMAPTEVLAEQHLQKFQSWMKNLPCAVWLLTGSTKMPERQRIFKELREGKPGVLIGTHALIEKPVVFRELGLVIIDEQHRFGVLQRAKLLEKGQCPDLLVMTATPIPRTLALTLYGDLDFSLLREKPPGRQKIETKLWAERDRKKIEALVEENLIAGHRVYWIFPLIEESEGLDLRDLTEATPQLEKRFKKFKVGVLHGRMTSPEKLDVLRKFSRGDLNLLISTTVVEVGVNVPEATMIVIENAERFGLSQLHQLRGRVGRGLVPSSCHLILGSSGGAKQKSRLLAMEKSEDGFELAELDLSLRGPGDFRGTKQAGLPQFRLANLIRDHELLIRAKADADSLISLDPDLKRYPSLKARVRSDLQSSFLH
jgi:ATP-dependent DNA helicase RecG